MLSKSLIILTLLTAIFISELATEVAVLNENPIENPIEKPLEGDTEQQEETEKEPKIRTELESSPGNDNEDFKSLTNATFSMDEDGYRKNQTPPPRQR